MAFGSKRNSQSKQHSRKARYGSFDLLSPVNGWDSFALAIPWGMPIEGNVPTVMAVFRIAGSASAHFCRGLVCLPVTELSVRGTLAPSVRRHDGSTVVFSRVAAGRAIGLTAISVWRSGGKCGQARFLMTETPIQLQVSRLACHTIPCPTAKVWGLQASDPRESVAVCCRLHSPVNGWASARYVYIRENMDYGAYMNRRLHGGALPGSTHRFATKPPRRGFQSRR